MFMAPAGDGDHCALGSGTEDAVASVKGKRAAAGPQVPDHRGRVCTGGLLGLPRAGRCQPGLLRSATVIRSPLPRRVPAAGMVRLVSEPQGRLYIVES